MRLKPFFRGSNFPTSASPAPKSDSQPPTGTNQSPTSTSSHALSEKTVEASALTSKDKHTETDRSPEGNEKGVELQGATGGGDRSQQAGAAKGLDTAETIESRNEKATGVTHEEDGPQAGQGEAEPEDESKYPKAWALYLLTFGLCTSTFVVALDNTIIATAIPRITTVFNSVNDVGWYGSSYLLTTTSLQPSFGKVYTYFNVKWTYILALVIFEVGSVICAASTSSTMLIVGRAVAGSGAAALFSGGLNIIGYSVPLRKRPIYMGLLSSMFGISSVIGPLLGGAFTDNLTWRWCFWINLPFGGIAIATVFIFFKNPVLKHTNLTTRAKIANIDLLGAFFLICAIVCLLLALQWGGSVYPWHDSRVWGCILGFGLILSVFMFIQFRLGDRATIPPRILLRQRTVLASAWFSCFLAMGLYSHIYFVPFYFQAVKGTSAEGSGIRTIPYLVSITLSSIIVGGSITVLGPYAPFTWVGSAIFVVGAGMIYTLKVSSGAGEWIGYQILAGVGAGACVQIPFIAIQVVLSKKDMPTGNAVAIFFNTLGGAFAVSIAQNIFSNSLIKYIPKYTQGVNPATIIAAGASHIREVTPPGQLAGVLKAYDLAVTSAFILPVAAGGLAFCFSLLFEWKSVKGKKLDMAAGAG